MGQKRKMWAVDNFEMDLGEIGLGGLVNAIINLRIP
jgi:hypothetical protein